MRPKAQSTKRAVIYVRISLDKKGEGLGVERQETECRALCDRNGWEIVEVFIDNDVSANARKARPEYVKALELIRSGGADVWVSWAYDRTMRKLADLDPFIDAIKGAGATAHFVQAGGIDLSTQPGQIMAGMLVLMARSETGMKSERQKAQERQRAYAGKRRRGGGKRPFGWQDDRLTLHPVEAPALAQAIHDVTYGKSLRSLIREWNADPELKSPRGAAWRYSTIRALLMRPANAGKAVYLKQVLPGVETEWEPIVTADEWETVCAVLASPDRVTTRGNRLKYYLSGLAKCGDCGAPMTVSAVNIRGKHRRIFRCKSGENHATRSFDPIEKAVTDEILDRLGQPDASDLFKPKSKKSSRVALKTIEATRQRLMDAERDYVDGLLNGQQLRSITATLEEQLREAQGAVAQATAVAVPEKVRRVKPERVREVWDSLAPVDQRTVAETLVSVTIFKQTHPKHGSLPYGCLLEWK